MIKVNLKLGGFSTVVGATLAIFLYNHSNLIIPETVSKGNGNIINFDKQFDNASVDPSLKMLEKMNNFKGKNERILIKITSPGGAVFEGKKLKVAMNAGLSTDTYISAFGASMAADIWAQGKRRYIEPDALVLFHGAYRGDYSSSQPVLTKKLTILESQEFAQILDTIQKETQTPKEDVNPMLGAPPEPGPNPTLASVSIKDKALYEELLREVIATGYDATLMTLKSEVDVTSVINSSMLNSMTTIVEQSNGKLTLESLRKLLFDDFSRDVVLTGQQLFDMGVATHLGAPNEADYVSE